MDVHEIVDRVSGWEGVLALRPTAGDGSPEISWGDVFSSVAPDGQVPSGQPFAIIVTRDHPGGTPDLLMPHPVYAEQGWVAVVDPHERTSDRVVSPFQAAHGAALTRCRRHGDTGPDGPVPMVGQPDGRPT